MSTQVKTKTIGEGKEGTMPSGKISWSDVTSPKEKEGTDGVYKGGASQSQPNGTPKVD